MQPTNYRLSSAASQAPTLPVPLPDADESVTQTNADEGTKPPTPDGQLAAALNAEKAAHAETKAKLEARIRTEAELEAEIARY